MKLGRHGPQCPVFKKGICSLIHNYVYYKKNIGHHRTDAVSISKVRSEKITTTDRLRYSEVKLN